MFGKYIHDLISGKEQISSISIDTLDFCSLVTVINTKILIIELKVWELHVRAGLLEHT